VEASAAQERPQQAQAGRTKARPVGRLGGGDESEIESAGKTKGSEMTNEQNAELLIQRVVLRQLIQNGRSVLPLEDRYLLSLTTAMAIADRMLISLDVIQRL
jgi:ABC-type branched-subunit amino acid transport system ATPase component